MIEVRRTPEGKVLVRRTDGQPPTAEDREAAKALLSQAGCPCWNCGQPMSEAKTIYGDEVWACWSCAKTA